MGTRKATGNCLLLEIPDRTARTVKRLINTHVVPGSLILTESFKSYAWLSRPSSGFVHGCVNHSRKEPPEQKKIFGKDIEARYGHLLAEFLWTAKCFARDQDTFADLLLQIRFWQDQHPQKETPSTSLKNAIPRDVEQQFLSVCAKRLPKMQRSPCPRI